MGLRRTDEGGSPADVGPGHPGARRRGQPAPPGRPCGRWVVVRRRLPRGTLVLLGDSDGVVHLAVIVAPDEAPGEAEEWVPLRACCPPSPSQAGAGPLLMHAIGLAEWHHATRFCPRCGGTLPAGRLGTSCAASSATGRSSPAPTRRSSWRSPTATARTRRCSSAATAPGRRGAGPPSPGSASRGDPRGRRTPRGEEEVGVQVGEVGYFGSQPWPLPASLMLGFTGRASPPTSTSTAPRSRRPGGGPGRSSRPRLRSGESSSRADLDLVLTHRGWFGRPLEGPGWD